MVSLSCLPLVIFTRDMKKGCGDGNIRDSARVLDNRKISWAISSFGPSAYLLPIDGVIEPFEQRRRSADLTVPAHFPMELAMVLFLKIFRPCEGAGEFLLGLFLEEDIDEAIVESVLVHNALLLVSGAKIRSRIAKKWQ